MSEIEYKPEGKQDPKLDYVLNLCKETVQMFLKAMEKMTVGMKFKAIELKNLSPQEVTPTVDLLSTAIAIELNSQAKETIQEITYNCYMEKVENEEGAYDLWITAKREKPDWTKVPKIEESPIQEL